MKDKTYIYKGYLLTYFMKTINETFTDEEHKELSKRKGKLSWHDFILKLLEWIGK